MKIAIGSDHAGFDIKGKIKQFLLSKGHEVKDFGTNSSASCDYPDYALAVAQSVSQHEMERGILICGSGIGMAVVANKIPKIRAGLCFNEETAKLSRLHNDCNILCLGARTTPSSENIEKLVDIWLNTSFEEGRHQRRVEKIKNIENGLLTINK